MSKKYLHLFLFVFFCNSIIAQQIIWEEHFDQDIPVEWNQDDISGGLAKWTYCAQQEEAATVSCPKIWNDGQNNQAAFAATSADDGFLVFDSDSYTVNSGLAHDVIIRTNDINIEGQEEIWLKFEYQIGVYLVPTDGNAFVEVITSQGQKRFAIKPLILGDNPYPEFIRWSRNPEIVFFNITDFVQGESSIKLRWRWKGTSEYFWAIDDIELYDSNPMSLWLPDNDVAITEFLSFPPAIKTPKSQLDPFGFFGDIINRSHQTKDSVWFKGEISKNGNLKFSDSVLVSTLEENSIRENIFFPNTTTPIVEKGFYDGSYRIINPGDETFENNSLNFTFEISDSIFAKDEEINDYARPADYRWADGELHDWAWGNIFYFPNGSAVKASGISFSFKPEEQGFDYTTIAGTKLTILLYEWNDFTGPTGQPDGAIQEVERNLIGVGDYEVTGEEQALEYVYQPFFEDDLLNLKDNTHYIAMVRFNGQITAQDIKLGAYVGTCYGSTLLRSQMINEPRFHSVLAVINGGSTTFDMLGFGFDISPTIRLHISEKTSKAKDILAINSIDISPNPATDQFTIRLDQKDQLVIPEEIKIFNNLGELVFSKPWPLENRNLTTFQFAQLLAGGIYTVVLERQNKVIAKGKLLVL